MIVYEQRGAIVWPIVWLPSRIDDQMPDPVAFWMKHCSGGLLLEVVTIWVPLPALGTPEPVAAHTPRSDGANLTPVRVSAGQQVDAVWVVADDESRDRLRRVEGARLFPLHPAEGEMA